jgi:OmpA-OmpF porin, OOP family
MKKLIWIALFLFALSTGNAQTSTHKWALSLNGNYKEYKGDLGKALLQFRYPNFQLGGGVSRYLNHWMDLSLNANYGKMYYNPNAVAFQEQYPVLNLKGINTNLTARIKFNNGKWLKEEAFLAPYVVAGVGLFYGDRQKPDYTPDWRKVEFFNFPVGLGVNIRCTPHLNVNVNSTWLPSFDDQLDGYVQGNNWEQLWEHRIGLSYNFNIKSGKNKDSKEEKAKEKKEKKAVNSADKEATK